MMTLDEKASQLGAYVDDRLLDPHHVVYASIEATSQFPWSTDNWNPDDDMVSVEGFSPWEVLNYENSGMCTGAYLAASSFEWKVTASPRAYERARKAFAGLQHIYDIGCQKEEGYFPKPYGDRLSHEISTDQYLYAIKAMMAWLPIAPRDEQEVACKMITTMVDFWSKRNYRYDYFSLKDMQWPLKRFPSLLYAAYNASGEERFLKEARRLNQEENAHLEQGETAIIYRARSGDPFNEVEQRFGNRYYGLYAMECAAMDIMQFDECLRHSEDHAEHWLKGMELSWQDGLLTLADNGLAYANILYDPITGQVEAPDAQWLNDGPDPLGWSFLRWTGSHLTPRSTMLARVGNHVAKWLPHTKPHATIYSILEKVDLDHMRHCVDPDGRQILPPHRFMTRWVDSDAITNWLWAYWEGRSEGYLPAQERHHISP